MFKTIGAALEGPSSTRCGRQPVRRHSHLSGRCEGTFWHRTTRQDLRQILLAARRFDLLGRAPGRRNGPLGHIALEALELLSHLVCHRTGRLEPSIAWLMQKLRRSRDAVTRALAALRAHGFLDWVRRYEPTGREGRGPQVRQVSNAYRFAMPPHALRLLGLHDQPVPLPDDVVQVQADREAAVRVLPVDELVEAHITDPWLGRLLIQMAARVPDRDSNETSKALSGKGAV